jgi:hypothetical protein
MRPLKNCIGECPIEKNPIEKYPVAKGHGEK